ncbi:unnamed protein product [Closterium sp. NIES-64]|nr:unnamed protein product [Closterium sp. NIES-64]
MAALATSSSLRAPLAACVQSSLEKCEMLGRPVSLAACAAPLTSANNAPAIAVRCAAKDGKAAAEPKSASHGHTGPRVVNRRLILGGLAAGMAAVVGCPICDSNGGSSIGAALAADSSKDVSGPMEWGELCSAGDAAQSATGGPLNAVNFPGGSNTCAVGGRQLQLLQYHFHAPSEHSFNGVRCPWRRTSCTSDDRGGPAAPRNLCLEAALAFAPGEKNKQMRGGERGEHSSSTVVELQEQPVPGAGSGVCAGREEQADVSGGRDGNSAMRRASCTFLPTPVRPPRGVSECTCNGPWQAPLARSPMPSPTPPPPFPAPIPPRSPLALLRSCAPGVLGVGGAGHRQVPAVPSPIFLVFSSLLPPIYPPLPLLTEQLLGVASPQECLEVAVVGRGGARSALQQCLRVQTSPQPLLPALDRPDASHAYIHYQGSLADPDASHAYIHYQGSLADPACSDVVDWLCSVSGSREGEGVRGGEAVTTPLKVPDSQVLEFLSFVGDRRTLAFNSRPRQDLGPRRLAVGPA